MIEVQKITYEDKVRAGTGGAIEGVTDTMRFSDANELKSVINNNADAFTENLHDYLQKLIVSVKPSVNVEKHVLSGSDSLIIDYDTDLAKLNAGEIKPQIIYANITVAQGATVLYTQEVSVLQGRIVIPNFITDVLGKDATYFSWSPEGFSVDIEVSYKLTDAFPVNEASASFNDCLCTCGTLAMANSASDAVTEADILDISFDAESNTIKLAGGDFSTSNLILSEREILQIRDGYGFDITDAFERVVGITYEGYDIEFAYRCQTNLYDVESLTIITD